MPEDHEVQREIWESKIPIQFVLASEEVAAEEQPKLYCVLVPRISYFPLVTEKVQKYFGSFVEPDDNDEMWLEYNGIALKWHYPIGVLYDLYKSDDVLPWQITVHFNKFPETELIRCPSKEIVESHFMQTVKEADQVKHRGEIISVMQKRDHKQLWSGLASDRFDQFWSINRKLMESTPDCPVRHVPLRIYKQDQTFVQKLCKPCSEPDERHTLLEDVLSSDVVEEVRQKDRYKIITHGVEIPLDTPVLWLCENMCYPDNFAHICILSRE